MNDFQNWLITKLPSLIPCQLSEIISGTAQLSLSFESKSGVDDPLSIRVKSTKKTDEISEDELKYSISHQRSDIQFVKRLQNTPFFISCLANEEFTLYIVDFYQWSPVTTLYRIFYFQLLDQDFRFELDMPLKTKKNEDSDYNVGDWYLTHSGSGTYEANPLRARLSFSGKEMEEKVLIFSFSEKKLSTGELSINGLIGELNKLEERAKKSHILKDIKVQDVKKQRLIDELWTRQKGLNPDRQLNALYSAENIPDIWTDELCHYMGWQSSGRTGSKPDINHFLNNREPIVKFCFAAYFEETHTPDEVIKTLQEWWDQYSLPLYRMKLLKSVATDPSLIFMIYSLATEMQLPWSDQLYRLSNFFYNQSQIALLACLFEMIVIRTKKDQTIQVKSGSGKRGNTQSIRRGKIEYFHTCYSKNNYTTVREKNVEILKIDKDVIVIHSEKMDQIAIQPHILPINLKSLHALTISIQVGNYLLQVPLLWKKAELSIAGCRIRWIYKKDRFQLTCHLMKPGSQVKIDGKDINFTDSNKIRLYHPVNKIENEGFFRLFDVSGRSFISINSISPKEVMLLGWMQDRHGLLVDRLNICLNSHQIFCSAQSSGLINASFDINPKLKTIGLTSRKINQDIPIRKIDNRSYLKYMSYLHSENKGTLIVVVDDELKIQMKEIQDLFIKNLGFIPYIIYQSEIKMKMNIPHIIYIGEKDTLYRFYEKSSFSKTSILSISSPGGIQQLFKILTGLA